MAAIALLDLVTDSRVEKAAPFSTLRRQTGKLTASGCPHPGPLPEGEGISGSGLYLSYPGSLSDLLGKTCPLA